MPPPQRNKDIAHRTVSPPYRTYVEAVAPPRHLSVGHDFDSEP